MNWLFCIDSSGSHRIDHLVRLAYFQSALCSGFDSAKANMSVSLDQVLCIPMLLRFSRLDRSTHSQDAGFAYTTVPARRLKSLGFVFALVEWAVVIFHLLLVYCGVNIRDIVMHSCIHAFII